MCDLIKKVFLMGLLLGTVQFCSAFSMLGQFDSWQVNTLSYQTRFSGFNEGPSGWSDAPLGGPMNLGEEYRMNVDTISYAVDQSFLDYFGSNGVYAIDQAMAIFNSLTNVSSYSSDLAEISQEATRVNFRAAALGLIDVKSAAMHYVIEQLGLADPVRYTWTLRERIARTACPVFEYHTIKRNFDPVTWEPSSYVNGTLYTYRIVEFCPTPDQAEAFEYRVDRQSQFYTAVASPTLWSGSFFTGLTRDDIGGLRYSMRTNNVNREDVPSGAVLVSGGLTNTAARQLLVTSNLATLVFASTTNNAAALVTLFPGLIIASTTQIFTNVVTTNTIAYFTNSPFGPSGSAVLVIASTLQTNVQIQFRHTFANVVTNSYYTNGFVTSSSTTVAQIPFAPAGVVGTTTSTTTTVSPFVNGEYFLVPADLCGYSIVHTQLVTVGTVTNSSLIGTNLLGLTTINGQAFTNHIITYFTNTTLVVDPIDCGTNGPAFRQGVEKINFVRSSFDSLSGQFFQPITNLLSLKMVTNSAIIQQTFRRIVTTPDILFTADDLGLTAAITRSIRLNSNAALANLPGPGLVEPGKIITFSKTGPGYINFGPFFLDEQTGSAAFVWGTFDGGTNAPIVYPSGTSIVDYESGILMQVTTTSLPNGQVGVAYSVQLQGSGGQLPYSWSLENGSAALPAGLSLSSSGIISGIPQSAFTSSLLVKMTDFAGRSVLRSLTLSANP